jgi:hypothetical protein
MHTMKSFMLLVVSLCLCLQCQAFSPTKISHSHTSHTLLRRTHTHTHTPPSPPSTHTLSLSPTHILSPLQHPSSRGASCLWAKSTSEDVNVSYVYVCICVCVFDPFPLSASLPLCLCISVSLYLSLSYPSLTPLYPPNLKEGGSGAEAEASPPKLLYGLIWIGLLAYATFLAPGSSASATAIDNDLILKVIAHRERPRAFYWPCLCCSHAFPTVPSIVANLDSYPFHINSSLRATADLYAVRRYDQCVVRCGV